MLAEGVKLAWDALDAELPVLVAAASAKLTNHKSGRDLRRRLEQQADEFLDCSDEVMQRLSSLTTQQGVALILARPEHDLAATLGKNSKAMVVAAMDVKDPGNLGAIMRTVEAAGASGLLAMKGGADPFRDKAVRGSSGSAFRVPIATGITIEALQVLRQEHGLQIVVADGRGEIDYLEVDYDQPTLLVVGGEAAGLPAEVLEIADRVVRISTSPAVESLNVAVAAGVILFEARRQRR